MSTIFFCIWILLTIWCTYTLGGKNIKKRLSYRKAKYKTAEQYGISINKKMIEDMGITENNREVDIHYDKSKNQIIIKKINL